MRKKIKLKVIEPIKSPYGIFANVGDVLVCDSNGFARNKNVGMVLTESEIKKCTRKFTVINKVREIIRNIT